ncbi:MAG TPA: hypothetical protein VJY62_17995 [Bacteroidia bacterium]|nr:hypothetical protein [Bacteroidia bacterium]
MKTLILNKKIYRLAIAAMALLVFGSASAQDAGKKENDSKDKKKKVTRITIYKDEDGKILKEDTTVVNGYFDWQEFSGNFDFNFDFNIPDLPELADLPEPPEPPMPPGTHGYNYYYYHHDNKMTPGEKEKIKEEMEKAKEEMKEARKEIEKAREEMKKVSKDELKKQMDDLKKQMEDLKKELNKNK